MSESIDMPFPLPFPFPSGDEIGEALGLPGSGEGDCIVSALEGGGAAIISAFDGSVYDWEAFP
jgi:hypothetical protein